jgi:ribonuclease HI
MVTMPGMAGRVALARPPDHGRNSFCAEKKGLYLLHIDGGNKTSGAGEMGDGAIGAPLKEPNGTAIPGAELSERIGPVESPTTAEYRALLRGLELARECGVNYLAVFSDSRILVNQMNRLWDAGDNLAPIRNEAEEMLRKFKGAQVSWIPRNWNKEADALVNKAFGPRTAPERSESKLRSKARKPAWKDLPPAEMAAHLLATPTLADRTWTEEQRLTGEKRDAFIRRILLGETAEIDRQT